MLETTLIINIKQIRSVLVELDGRGIPCLVTSGYCGVERVWIKANWRGDKHLFCQNFLY